MLTPSLALTLQQRRGGWVVIPLNFKERGTEGVSYIFILTPGNGKRKLAYPQTF